MHPSSCFVNYVREFVMLHLLDVVEERLHEAIKILKAGRLPESLEVLLRRFPFDAKNESIPLFDTLRKLERDTVRRLPKIPGRLLVGFEERCASVDSNTVSGVFNNHFALAFRSENGGIWTIMASIITQQLSFR